MMRGGSGTEMEMGMVRKGKMDEVGEQLASIEGTCALVCVWGGSFSFGRVLGISLLSSLGFRSVHLCHPGIPAGSELRGPSGPRGGALLRQVGRPRREQSPLTPASSLEFPPPLPQREPACSPTSCQSDTPYPTRWGGRVLARETSDSELFEQGLISFISNYRFDSENPPVLRP